MESTLDVCIKDNVDVTIIYCVDGAITPELRQEIRHVLQGKGQKVDVDGRPEIAKTHVAANADEWERACCEFRDKK